jgi:hypothetical protein
MHEFVVLKVQKSAASQQRALLHTLIPPNVLENMATATADDGLCTAIQHVTIMFCSWNFNVTTKKDFYFLTCILEALDKAVQVSGMFKYQHVSCGNSHYYIVGCPRVACPFDEAEQSSEYPATSSFKMIELGHQLARMTSSFASTKRPLHMKVGINCGPVASVVLGKCR